MNHERVTKTLHTTSLRLAAALAEDPTDARVRQAAHVIVELAEYVDRSFAASVTLLRGGYDAPSLHRQLDEAQEEGPVLRDTLVQLHSNVVDLDAERARRRGATRIPGA